MNHANIHFYKTRDKNESWLPKLRG